MGLLRTIKYWLAGGRARWFARKTKQLPAGAPALVEVVEVGLELDPETAVEVVRTHEVALRGSSLVARVATLTTAPALRIGWILARDRASARRLALHLATKGQLDELATHVDACLDLVDRELFEEIQAAATGTSAAWQLCQSCCYEQFGDHLAALRACHGPEDRRFALIERLQADALALATTDASKAMTALTVLRDQLASEREPSAGWLERRGALERHRTELLRATRSELRKGDDRASILAAAAFEELAGEWGEAALLYERAGELADRLKASQLWEKDERYGDAVRALGPLSDRAEVKLRMAQLRDSGGDAAGAATLFEHLERWSEACRAHEAAGNWVRAAHCYVEQHGVHEAARSPDYAKLLVKARRIDELAQLYVDQLATAPGDRAVLERIGTLDRERIESPLLRETIAKHAVSSVAAGVREAFDRGAAGWIAKARREVEQRYGRIWGMDLGTSKSAVAVFDLDAGRSIICPDKAQSHFSSTLALDVSGAEIVGLDARDQLRADLRGCIENSKRAMGTRKVYKIGDRQFSPEEVAARLLAHGRGLVEGYLRERVTERVLALARAELGDAPEASWIAGDLAISRPQAVITIPAYFNFDQRRATRDAVAIAGLDVQRLVPEPTAACLSAALTRKLSGKLLVIDLGAGTLDLSYLDASHDKGEGFFEVERVFGDTQLGSADFDAAIEKHLLGELGQLSPLDRRRLHAAAEQLKISLSTSVRAREELVAFAGRERHVLELTAERFEALIAPLLARLEATCKQAVGPRIDHLVLVGGPMFSPLIKKRIEAAVGRKADAVVDPRAAVAMGAACQGAVLSDHGKVPFLLLDIAPFALGVSVREVDKPADLIAFQVPRGTRIPHDAKRIYSTHADNQTGVDVQIFQGVGDSTDPAANTRLAMMHLDGIAPAKAGEPKIGVTFRIDSNGLLEVTAVDEATGRSRSVRIEDATWLSPGERTEMTKRMTESQRLARERAELAAIGQQIAAISDAIAELETRASAPAWQRHFDTWQRASGAPERLESHDEALLGEMYNSGTAVSDRMQLAIDRTRSLRARAVPADRAGVEQRLGELREAHASLDALDQQFRRWNACLARASHSRLPASERFAIHHDAGDWSRALDAFDGAFETPPLVATQRRLDALARLGRRDDYRRVLAEQRDALSLVDIDVGRLNDLARHVQPAIAWVWNGEQASGSGFLVRRDLVVTNRHVIDDPARVVAIVGGARRTVRAVRFPIDAGIDLAVLELAEPVEAAPVRIGYGGLVEIGERVIAIGFPLPEGTSFAENLLIDHGIVNRVRSRATRELELGLRLAPGMSGGPVFNDRGEVVAVSTFIRFHGGLDRSCHAIAVDALHELLPRPWS